MRIAWRPLLANMVIDSEVLDACERAAMALGELGAVVEPMDDDMEPIEPIWFAYSSTLWSARFRDQLPQWGNRLSPTLLRQMELGKDITGEAVARALLARTQLYRKVQGWFQRFDVIAMPTLTRTAIPIEERLFEPIEIEGSKVDTVRKAWYPYTHPFNLTGHPAITLPCGFHSDGLPMAIQLVGRRGEDARVLRVAALYEQARPWAGKRPQIEGLDGCPHLSSRKSRSDYPGPRSEYVTLGPGYFAHAKFRDDRSKHAERQLGLVRHAVLVPGRVEGERHFHLADAGHGGHGVLDPGRHLARHRAAWRRQRHLDRNVAVVVDVDLVDQPQLVDVGGNLGVVHGLQGRDDVGGELLQLLRRDRRAGRRRRTHRLLYLGVHGQLHSLLPLPACGERVGIHPKKSRALISASASASTSALVLYMANDARQVAVTPRRSISGWAQWWPARTATPERSMMVEMSCGCRPSMPNETMAPLSFAVP
jgi:hypothetical protein